MDSLDFDVLSAIKVQLEAIEHSPPPPPPEPAAPPLSSQRLARLVKTPEGQKEAHAVLFRTAAAIVINPKTDLTLLNSIVRAPVQCMNAKLLEIATEAWSWLLTARPDIEAPMTANLLSAWCDTIRRKRGLFSPKARAHNPLNAKTEFTPTDKAEIAATRDAAVALLRPHNLLLAFLVQRFKSLRTSDREIIGASVRMVLETAEAHHEFSNHPLSRELRMRFLAFGFSVLHGCKHEATIEERLRWSLYYATLSWFETKPTWTYGSSRQQLDADKQALEMVRKALETDRPVRANLVSVGDVEDWEEVLPSYNDAKEVQRLLLLLLKNEINRVVVWINPLLEKSAGPLPTNVVAEPDSSWRQLVRTAWAHNPAVAIHIPERFRAPAVKAAVIQRVQNDPWRAVDIPEAVPFLVGDKLVPEVRQKLLYLIYWAPVPVVSALRYIFPGFGGDPLLLQYSMRVLEHHPIAVSFFYIPQIVQALRSDDRGYAERLVFETSKVSQLFCHQIIWNMKANTYKDDAAEVPDPMKPTLDRMSEMIVGSLSGEAKAFYEKEFSFFDTVTSISRKLQPFIKKPKPEKKAKIDEEIKKIDVVSGVYLPSNPDGVVVDIDRDSGRPLQSHAKAPFMATFKVKRDVVREAEDDDPMDPDKKENSQEKGDHLVEQLEGAETPPTTTTQIETWQAAIFKVGDDCRQDVLALQIIAMSKAIFTSLGLDLQVTPYRVTATGPGCGVIDVIPNATSRDEMGRGGIPDFQAFFLQRFGSPDGENYSNARLKFIESMAAYSLLCYIVQIKDRHNGNIMIDGEGRITHIDFGFLFDIGPGGIKFEPNSFKLSHEMVTLMGGAHSAGFTLFKELTVKAFLACRPYADALIDTARLMMAADFPSFKGEATMTRYRERFRLDLSERDAAEYMQDVIGNAFENKMSLVYDEFQRQTNGIPYAR